jgi:hypothetical protein
MVVHITTPIVLIICVSHLCHSTNFASLRSDNGNPSEHYLVHRPVSALDTFECERKRQWQASDDVTQ